MARMHRNKSVDVNRFAMVPRAEIPRSSFTMERTYKTTFDAGYLVPVFCEEILPGDTFNVSMTAFCRLATPLFPFMDNIHLDSFFFFVPNRCLWTNWKRFMGEQDNPASSISFSIPQIVYNASFHTVSSVYDYFGLPVVGQIPGGNSYSHSALPMRAYNFIYNEWFRDENLQNTVVGTMPQGDGPDLASSCVLQRRGKRKDYFTGALPWPQKGGVAVSIPLGTQAIVRTNATDLVTGAQQGMRVLTDAGANLGINVTLGTAAVGSGAFVGRDSVAGFASDGPWYPSNLYADLTTATAATINQLRQSFQIQKLLERDARGGTRYTEIVRAHFGVVSPDARLQRPEYLGGGSSPIVIVPVPQTSNTAAPPTPLGTLSATGTALARHGFSQSFTEHGYVIGLVSARADLTYQQGLRRHWSRLTRYDYYFPAFAMLGEQAILNKEIWCRGDAGGTVDNAVFGYQERWAEYRYLPSEITSLFRSTAAGTLDPWHLSINFTALPTLGSAFIVDDPPIDRVIAVPAQPHFLADMFFSVRAARPLPLYSVPGLIDHF